MPHRFLRAVEPIVTHGLREMSVEGASLGHTLWEVALMGALVGTGLSPRQAIRRVEIVEPQLLGMHPGEAVEPYHAGVGKGWGAKSYGMEESTESADDDRRGVLDVGLGMQALPTGKGAPTPPFDKGGPGMLPFDKGGQTMPLDFSAQATLSGKGTLTAGVGTPTMGKGMPTMPPGKGMQAVPPGKGMPTMPPGKGMQAVPPGKGMQPLPYGKGMQAVPYGKSMQTTPYGKGMQTMPYGKGMQAPSFGKGMQAPSYGKGMPMGKGKGGMKGGAPLPFSTATSPYGTWLTNLPQGKGMMSEN